MNNSKIANITPIKTMGPQETGAYLHTRLLEKSRVYQKKTKCSDAERLRFENNAAGALLAHLGIRPVA